MIALNGGTLPASPRAVRRAGLRLDPDLFTNSGPLAHPRLGWLGDVFAVPSSVPFANVYSVGDVLVLLGAGWLLLGTCLPSVPRATTPVDPLLSLTKADLVELLEQAWSAERALRRELQDAQSVPRPRASA